MESERENAAESYRFTVSSWRENRILLLVLRGEIDMHTVGKLRKALDQGLADEFCRDVILNMSAVTFVDSTGYSTFIETEQRMQQRGNGHVYLAGCQPNVMRTITIARFDRILRLCNTVEDANAAISASTSTE